MASKKDKDKKRKARKKAEALKSDTSKMIKNLAKEGILKTGRGKRNIVKAR